jgi:hypothetical protein
VFLSCRVASRAGSAPWYAPGWLLADVHIVGGQASEARGARATERAEELFVYRVLLQVAAVTLQARVYAERHYSWAVSALHARPAVLLATYSRTACGARCSMLSGIALRALQILECAPPGAQVRAVGCRSI